MLSLFICRRRDLSWICFTLSEFRLSSFATVGSICSLTGLISLRSLRPSANPLNPLFCVSRQYHHTIKKAITKVIAFFICRRRDLNPHGFPHTPLKRARIPIPSRRHLFCRHFANDFTMPPHCSIKQKFFATSCFIFSLQ